ncbi:hypothetical protein [Leptodesmis sichuanensis]|uniref:hypothetical protein n=1 Tax=Leptodesmis sichuanensis TaxID=2906798 RepID=UPI001F2631DB|nr:hypothetical protein [Leptodesmis sichuanensis]UIE38378.1 hypothetical protein KIK02_01580 [Leptodesmis sichuanensis A121]
MLAQRRTDRPLTTPHSQSPGRFRDHRSPLATALTDTLLGAFATTNRTQMTALPDKLLSGFGLTNPAEERVQGLAAELANSYLDRSHLPIPLIWLDRQRIVCLRSSNRCLD